MSTQEDQRDLRRLQADCQAILDDLSRRDELRGMIINAADLHCITAERWENHKGNTGHRVWIEEADDAAFEVLVRERLKDWGWEGVDVRTEW
jgi:hypothetical protein